MFGLVLSILHPYATQWMYNPDQDPFPTQSVLLKTQFAHCRWFFHLDNLPDRLRPSVKLPLVNFCPSLSPFPSCGRMCKLCRGLCLHIGPWFCFRSCLWPVTCGMALLSTRQCGCCRKMWAWLPLFICIVYLSTMAAFLLVLAVLPTPSGFVPIDVQVVTNSVSIGDGNHTFSASHLGNVLSLYMCLEPRKSVKRVFLWTLLCISMCVCHRAHLLMSLDSHWGLPPHVMGITTGCARPKSGLLVFCWKRSSPGTGCCVQCRISWETSRSGSVLVRRCVTRTAHWSRTRITRVRIVCW